jgi:hypothetical protein
MGGIICVIVCDESLFVRFEEYCIAGDSRTDFDLRMRHKAVDKLFIASTDGRGIGPVVSWLWPGLEVGGGGFNSLLSPSLSGRSF